MQFTYHINLDERGSFEADVRNPFGKTVFAIAGAEIFEDGFMKDKNDVAGLQKYLQQLNIIRPTDTVISSDRLAGHPYKTQMHAIRSHEKMADGGGFSLEYLNDPDYKELDTEYKRLLEENKKLDKLSPTLRKNIVRMEDLQNRKKQIALGNKFSPMPFVSNKEAYAERGHSKSVRNKHFIHAPIMFKKGGGLSSESIESLLEDYEPQFQYFEKSDVDNDNRAHRGEKIYVVYFKVPRDVFDKIEHGQAYREQQIEHFKNFGYSKGMDTLLYDISTNDQLEIVAEITQLT